MTPIQQIASELAPALDSLHRDWLGSDMRAESKEHRKLQMFLWDNKVGVLRVLEAVDPTTKHGAR